MAFLAREGGSVLSGGGRKDSQERSDVTSFAAKGKKTAATTGEESFFTAWLCHIEMEYGTSIKMNTFEPLPLYNNISFHGDAMFFYQSPVSCPAPSAAGGNPSLQCVQIFFVKMRKI